MDSDKDYCKNAPEAVNHPKHYTSLGATCEECGADIECIQISERFGFCLGNVIKYTWRAELKGKTLEDLQKAVWYLNREIERRKRDGGEEK